MTSLHKTYDCSFGFELSNVEPLSSRLKTDEDKISVSFSCLLAHFSNRSRNISFNFSSELEWNNKTSLNQNLIEFCCEK